MCDSPELILYLEDLVQRNVKISVSIINNSQKGFRGGVPSCVHLPLLMPFLFNHTFYVATRKCEVTCVAFVILLLASTVEIEVFGS